MNPRTLGSSILLTVVVAVTVLLIGAFAHFDNSRGEGSDSSSTTPPASPFAADPVTPAPPATPSTTPAAPPTLPADLSPGLAEVIKLAQSHVAEETIVAFVQNSGKPYNPTAEEVLYLYDLGLSDKVISALFKKPDAVAAAPATPAPAPDNAPAPPNAAMTAPPEEMIQPPPAAMTDPVPVENPQDSYFYDDLAPYGSWVQVVDIGWCWQPMVSSVDTGWMPYRDRGHWVFTDEGWYWASDYSWGWAAFHYGRWSHHDQYGWVWAPGSVWSPAWVAWRHSDAYAGWAPLPPHALFQPGIGVFTGQGLAGFDAGFGLSASAYTFVTFDHFLSPRLSGFAVPAAQVPGLHKVTTPVNNYSIKGHRVIDAGISPDRIAAATKTPVRTFALQEALSPETSGGKVRGQLGLAVFRPDLTASTARSAAGAPPQPVLINRTARQDAVNSGMATAPAVQEAPSRTGYSGFTSGNFQPPPKRINPSADVSAPALARAPAWNGSDAGRPAPSQPMPRIPAPSYSVPERREPVNNPAPPAPYENRGGGQAYSSPPQAPAPSASGTTSSASKNSNGR
jgi:hypothetical protein